MIELKNMNVTEKSFQSFQILMHILQVGFKVFLQITPLVTAWNAANTECSLVSCLKQLSPSTI